MPIVPIRRVLVRDPLDRFEPQALLYTDITSEPAHIFGWFMQRWQFEVIFQPSRGQAAQCLSPARCRRKPHQGGIEVSGRLLFAHRSPTRQAAGRRANPGRRDAPPQLLNGGLEGRPALPARDAAELA